MKNPKKHHFVPESYLSGFTKTNRRNGKLWVIDQLKVTIRLSTPENEAHKRYFNKVNVTENGDEFGIEKGFSKFENLSIPIIKEIGKKLFIPTGENFNILMNYLTLQIVRTPKFRYDFEQMTSAIYDKFGKVSLRSVTQSKEYFDKYVEDMLKRKPHLKELDFDFEKIKKSINNIKFKANIDQNYYVKHSLSTINTILPLLSMRNWNLLIPENNSSNFISSDNPVVLTWSNFENFGLPIGFGLMGTSVIFPINKSVAIWGKFEDNNEKILLDDKNLSIINNYIANTSNRFLYCCEEKVLWFKRNKEIGSLPELLDFIKENIENENS